jgi:hypothetical protein
LIERMVSLGLQADRIDQAHTARLTRRMYHGVFDLLRRSAAPGASRTSRPSIQSVAPVPTVMMGSIDQPGPTISDLMSPPDEPAFEPDPPIEANLERENAPNEANSHVQAPSRERGDGRKDCRIDTPHIERKPSGIGNKGKEKIHPALERALGGRNSNLVNLSSIFGEM